MAKQESLRTISPEEFHNRHLEERKDFFREHQTPSPSWHELPFSQREGYQSLEWNNKTYLHRQSAKNLTETVLLDNNGRTIEYWQNWDEPTQRVRHSNTYDSDGFVTSTTVLKGNGYGSSMRIEYLQDKEENFLYDENNKRIPKQATIQHYFGDPQRFAFSHRELEHGENEGDPIVINLIEKEE